jgi:hypothetical protein
MGSTAFRDRLDLRVALEASVLPALTVELVILDPRDLRVALEA